jgi:NADH-quinone oxidoreductase subunit D
MAVQLGALTPVFYAFRYREFILNQIEAVSGGRFHPNFDRIGGLKDDPEGLGRGYCGGAAANRSVLRPN